MDIELPFGKDRVNVQIAAAPENVFVAKSKNPKTTQSWEELVKAALKEPLDSERLSEMSVKGKKVAILVDDKSRPTPAYKIAPIVLDELKKAGAKDRDLWFVIACGLHEKMTPKEVEKKLGEEVVNRYEVCVHDAFDDENLVFFGVSMHGTPIWVNKNVASADFRVAIGRITRHSGFGYEGGSKMILPGVSGCITVTHNHSMIPSPMAGYGSHRNNPSRTDADDVAGIVGLDFIVNVVVNHKGEPFKAVAGHYKSAHQAGIDYGNEHIWGAYIPRKADITIASPASEVKEGEAFSDLALNMAALGTKPGGTIILLTKGESETNMPHSDPFLLEIQSMSYEELLRQYARRDVSGMVREAHWRCKNIRGEISKRKPFLDKKVILVGGKIPERTLRRFGALHTQTMSDAVEMAFSQQKGRPFFLILPDAQSTQPIVKTQN